MSVQKLGRHTNRPMNKSSQLIAHSSQLNFYTNEISMSKILTPTGFCRDRFCVQCKNIAQNRIIKLS